MSFSKMIELLQNKDKGKIILINSGAFYIARGKDAVLLNKILDLKVNCMETEICKVGFPKNSLEKYIKLIQEKGYSYIVYNFDSNISKLTILKKHTGNKLNKIEENKLQLIPKTEKYIEYILQIIIKLPRTEKFNIGNEYKQSMYKMLRNIMYLSKIEKNKCLEILNKIDAELNTQRIFLRIMKNNKWLDERKFKIAMEHTTFYVTEPKLRKIEKSRYIDRIVHRWLVDNFLEPAFVPQFINTSFACLKNKGMHKACLYVQKTMQHCTRIWGEYYILKMDVAKYFDNINKEILLKIIQRKIKDPKIIWLIQEILYSQKREKGLEIGNYTSQMFANIYLNEVDQFIKHKLNIKYYCRYLDDSIVIVKTKKEAKNASV